MVFEYLSVTLDDLGAGGHSHDFAINAAAQGGTWRIKALTDPNGDPIGETSFLVEDYIPDRIEFDLKSKSAAATVGDGATFTVDGRYLFGAPGAGLDLEANLVDHRRQPPLRRMEGLSVRPDGRARRHHPDDRRPTCRRPTSTAMPISSCACPTCR